MLKRIPLLLLAFALTACGSMQQAVNAYGGAAISSAQQANDSYALAWSAAACGTTIGAAYRNPQLIPALQLLCNPARAVDTSTLLAPLNRPGRE